MIFRVHGEIVSYKSPKFSSENNKVFQSKRVKEYQQFIGFSAKKYMMKNDVKKIIGPVGLSIKAFFSPPKSRFKDIKAGNITHTTYPDCSNILKLVEDALKDICFEDDRYVVCAIIAKEYVKNIDDESYIEIHIEEISNAINLV
jgi:Holliday junction resolvase RusA-like endonuclease